MEIFQPNLMLVREPDGEYTLNSAIITPNSSYSAGRARPEPPPNVRLTPEVFPVLLDLNVRNGPHVELLGLVRHQLRNLRLAGKTRVIAFAMIGGNRIVGSASIAVPAAGPPQPSPVVVNTQDWYAWVNRMPPGPASFHVTGTVLLPTPGYTASLEPAAPQGINPADLILDLKLAQRAGVWPAVITPVTVRYDVSDYHGNYQTVLVREPDGDASQLPVEEVF